MRRTLLLRWAACFVACAFGGSLSLLAQTDVTNTYLVNPSFEGENVASLPVVGTKGEGDSYRGWTLAQPTGWTVTEAAETYQLKDSEAYTDNGYGQVGTMANGTYCFYLRHKWGNKDVSIKQTLSGLLPGEYTLTASIKAMKQGGSPSAYLTAAGKNSSSVTFAAGSSNAFTSQAWYTAQVSFTVNSESDVEIALNVNKDKTDNAMQIAIDNFTLTYTAFPMATADDYDALEAAISSSESKVLGFEVGEYAPYMNVDAIKALPLAKAINRAISNSQLYVQELTNTLTTGWTVNATQQNGFYRGDFADYQTSDISGDNRAVATGWSNTATYYCGVVGLKATEPAYGNTENLGLGGLTSKKALYLRGGFNTTYGQTAGYTLPLKAHAIYTLAFSYGGWGQHKDNAGTVTVGQDGSTPIYNAAVNTTGNGNENAEAWQSFNTAIHTTDAGNYEVKLDCVAGGQSAFSDFTLTLQGYEIQANASTLTDAPLTADTWYCFDIATAGDYKLTASTDLGDITYVTDGTLIESTAGTAFSVDANNVQNLAVGRYYIKSASAQTLSVAVYSLADADDYEALANAIAAAEDNIGFEDGEYAPYNNISMLATLAEAKTIDTTADNPQATIQAMTDALAASNWTANDGEVNAIYDGSFDAASSNVATNTVPTGWHGSDSYYNDALMTRYVYSNGSGNNGLYNHFANHSAMMSKSYPTYGKDEGYTLPLKANTWYKLTFDFGGWGPCTRTTTIVVKDANGAAVAVSPAESAAATDGAQDDENKWKTYTGYFKTDAKGNYTLQLRKDSEQNNGEWQIAYGDIVLKKAETTTANMKVAAGKWGTFIAPFDVAIPADVEAYKVTGIVNDTYMDKEEVTTTIPANTPVVLKNVGEDDVDTDLLIPNTATEVAYTEGLLTGVYTAATIAASDASNTRYVLQTQDEVQAFYKVDAAFTAKPNRAYLTVPAAASAKKMLYFDFDDAATAIAGIEPTETEDDAPAYNVAGQRVQNGYKGIVIKNGVKYLNK